MVEWANIATCSVRKIVSWHFPWGGNSFKPRLLFLIIYIQHLVNNIKRRQLRERLLVKLNISPRFENGRISRSWYPSPPFSGNACTLERGTVHLKGPTSVDSISVREIQPGVLLARDIRSRGSRDFSQSFRAAWCVGAGHGKRGARPCFTAHCSERGEGSRRGPLCIPTSHPEHNFSRQDFALVMSAPRRNTVSRCQLSAGCRASSSSSSLRTGTRPKQCRRLDETRPPDP